MKPKRKSARKPKRKAFFERARSAITGRFISLAEARRRPRTSIIEKVRRSPE